MELGGMLWSVTTPKADLALDPYSNVQSGPKSYKKWHCDSAWAEEIFYLMGGQGQLLHKIYTPNIQGESKK